MLVSIIAGDKKEMLLGLSFSALGAGCAFGPPLGALVYQKYNFHETFFAFSIIVTFDAFAMWFLVPNKLNYVNPNAPTDPEVANYNSTHQD